jgi:hypothetical protein
MAKIVSIAILALLLALPQGIAARPRMKRCKGNPKIVANCFTFHGRMQYTNGTPDLRIRHVGTKRILGVVGTSGTPDDAENANLPKNLNMGFDEVFYADFEVCPLTKETPSEMQMVCVESAEHIVIRKSR